MTYDGGIAPLRFALGLGAQQLPVRQLFNVPQSSSLRAVLRWRSRHGVNQDCSVSPRLYNNESEIVFQKDQLLRNQANSLPTAQWSRDTRADSLHPLDLPVECELRLVVYDFETLLPTVEDGV